MAQDQVYHVPSYMNAAYCPDDKHLWRELRGKNGKEGDSWFMFKGCKNCPATLETIVTHEHLPNGELKPKVQVFLLTGYGMEKKTVTKEVAGVGVVAQPAETKLIRG